MPLIFHQKFLNKDLIPLFLEINKDFIEKYECFDQEHKIYMKPTFSFLPPYFVRVKVDRMGENIVRVVNVTDTATNYVQLNVLTTDFTLTFIGDYVNVEGELEFLNEFPDMIQKGITKTKENLLRRSMAFMASQS